MKKIVPFLLLLTVFAFLSCNDDNSDSATINSEDIVGSWTMTNLYSENGKVTFTANGQKVTGDYSLTGKDYDVTLTFTETPNEVTSSGSLSLVGTTTALGQTLSQEVPAQGFGVQSGNWSINGNTLTVNSSGNTDTFTIKELNENSFLLTKDLSSIIPSTSDISVSGQVYLKFVK